MKKTKIDLDIILPEIPNERDECVGKIIQVLECKKGIEKVHVVPHSNGIQAKLCFHYDADVISISDVEALAKEAGAKLTEHYGHSLFVVSGIRHIRHARTIENDLKRITGIVSVSVSANGFVQLEYEREHISQEQIQQHILKNGLRIQSIDDLNPQIKDVHASHNHTEHDDTHDRHNHKHSNGEVLGEKTELIFAVISGALLGIGFGLSFITDVTPFIPIACYIGAYFFGGFFTTKEAVVAVRNGVFLK